MVAYFEGGKERTSSCPLHWVDVALSTVSFPPTPKAIKYAIQSWENPNPNWVINELSKVLTSVGTQRECDSWLAKHEDYAAEQSALEDFNCECKFLFLLVEVLVLSNPVV